MRRFNPVWGSWTSHTALNQSYLRVSKLTIQKYPPGFTGRSASTIPILGDVVSLSGTGAGGRCSNRPSPLSLAAVKVQRLITRFCQ